MDIETNLPAYQIIQMCTKQDFREIKKSRNLNHRTKEENIFTFQQLQNNHVQ